MLVEGNHAYPYQPYNGAIVHEKQLNAALEGYIQFIGTITDINNASIGEYQKPFYGFVNSNTGNAPTTSGGTLFTNNHSATYASQQYITDTGRFYMRDKQEGTWNAWKQIANQDWVQANYLPLTGGTINGDLNVTGEVEENGERVYSPNNEPPYPVTSVAEKTGDVSLSKSDVGLGSVDNIRQYSANNPPPYPVTSVNGMGGAVQIHLYAHMFRATCANMTGYVYFYYLSNSPNAPSVSEIISHISTSGFLPASSSLIGPNGVYFNASRIIVQSSSLYVAVVSVENPLETTMQLFNILRVSYTTIV